MTQLPTSENGSVTAEFALVLPAAFMVIAISIGALSVQVERMRLVSVTAELARASARGEPEEVVGKLYAKALAGQSLSYSTDGKFSCVEISRQVQLLGLPGFSLRLADKECARRVGL